MARKRDPFLIYKVVSVVAVIVAIFALAQPYFSKVKETVQLLPISELSTQGFTKVDVQASISGNLGVVTLTGSCYQLTATTEASQAESIINGLEKRTGFRPNTHDLMKDALDSLSIDVVMVKITELQNNTYFGRLILKKGNDIASLDSRPSDGIAVAVRVGAPVYIKDELLKAQGRYVC